jgi:hypothetical protein
MSRIRVIAEDVRHWSGKNDDLLGALQLMFDKERLKSIFPQRIEDRPSEEDPNHRRFTFNQDYVSHLASMMMLSCATLNEFLRAVGSNRTFSYRSSKYYDRQNFEEVLYWEWPAQTIALSLEKRLLEQIVMAHRAISLFIANADYAPGRGMPRPASPAFTDNSMFTRQVAGTLSSKPPTIVSPRQEDTTWTSNVENEVQASFYQAASEAFQEQSEAATSYDQQDKERGRSQSLPTSKRAEAPQEETTPTMKTNGICLTTLKLVVNHQDTVQPPVLLTTPTLEAPFQCKFAGTLQVMTLLLALPALPEPPTIPVEPGYCPLKAPEGRKVHQALLANADSKEMRVHQVKADPLVHPDHPEEAHKGHLDHPVLQALQHLELPEWRDYDSKRSWKLPNSLLLMERTKHMGPGLEKATLASCMDKETPLSKI